MLWVAHWLSQSELKSNTKQNTSQICSGPLSLPPCFSSQTVAVVHEKVECLMLKLFISLWKMHLSCAKSLFNIRLFSICVDRNVGNREYREIRADLKLQTGCASKEWALQRSYRHIHTKSSQFRVEKNAYFDKLWHESVQYKYITE